MNETEDVDYCARAIAKIKKVGDERQRKKAIKENEKMVEFTAKTVIRSDKRIMFSLPDEVKAKIKAGMPIEISVSLTYLQCPNQSTTK